MYDNRFSDYCLIGTRFIHFIRTDSNVFLFMAAFHTGSDSSLPCFEEGHGAVVLHFSLDFQSERSPQSCFWGSPLGCVSAGLPALLRRPAGGAKAPLTRGRRTLCLQTGLGDQLAGTFSPQGRQGSGFRKRGCVQAERSGLASVPQQGGAAGGKHEDKVDVSCVQLSADWRPISADSGESGPCAKWWVFS